ncbi:MAG: hypothetical protein U0793_14000 [Gemmataceae bacterium]
MFRAYAFLAVVFGCLVTHALSLKDNDSDPGQIETGAEIEPELLRKAETRQALAARLAAWEEELRTGKRPLRDVVQSVRSYAEVYHPAFLQWLLECRDYSGGVDTRIGQSMLLHFETASQAGVDAETRAEAKVVAARLRAELAAFANHSSLAGAGGQAKK